ncbi:hypothetical protein Fcan01_10267 [Folsomia candida]|uniref:Uncharacterized protein n=1 Tax=Folsomia candida TaxID=158441 RepID=A0A226E9X6_FOLCA|nr:hypothetical protein Fcan01_10267 [Folsomia candida]
MDNFTSNYPTAVGSDTSSRTENQGNETCNTHEDLRKVRDTDVIAEQAISYIQFLQNRCKSHQNTIAILENQLASATSTRDLRIAPTAQPDRTERLVSNQSERLSNSSSSNDLSHSKRIKLINPPTPQPQATRPSGSTNRTTGSSDRSSFASKQKRGRCRRCNTNNAGHREFECPNPTHSTKNFPILPS